jgi:hypothetical protein
VTALAGQLPKETGERSMVGSNLQQPRVLEVAQRIQGEVEVALFWNRDTCMASVVLWNWTSGTCLHLNAEPHQAKYAFAHPYAYAAACGVSERDIQRAA